LREQWQPSWRRFQLPSDRRCQGASACCRAIQCGIQWRTQSWGLPQWHRRGKPPGRSRSRCTLTQQGSGSRGLRKKHLGHVNVVTGGTAGTIRAGLGFNGDGLGRADCLAQLASNAALLTRLVTAEGMLPTETGRDGTLLVGVVKSDLWLEEVLNGNGGGCGSTRAGQSATYHWRSQ